MRLTCAVRMQLANNKTPRPDQYLFLFLKFISAVIPCIEYDNTNNGKAYRNAVHSWA